MPASATFVSYVMHVQAETYQSQLEPRMAEVERLKDELRGHDKELLTTATQLLVCRPAHSVCDTCTCLSRLSTVHALHNAPGGRGCKKCNDE